MILKSLCKIWVTQILNNTRYKMIPSDYFIYCDLYIPQDRNIQQRNLT